MSHKEATAEHVTDEKGRKVLKAIIMRPEVMFGSIRIKCPVDMTEHEVAAGTKEFICPVGAEVLAIDA